MGWKKGVEVYKIETFLLRVREHYVVFLYNRIVGVRIPKKKKVCLSLKVINTLIKCDQFNTVDF